MQIEMEAKVDLTDEPETVVEQDALMLVGPPPGLVEYQPGAVLANAKRAAEALASIISQKARPVMMNGQQYLEFEDWQTVGRFYGVTACVEGSPEYVEFGSDVRGFKATAVALHLGSGKVISRATAYCLTDEEKWRGRTKYEWAYVTTDGTREVEDPGKDRIVWEPNPNKPGNRPRKERIALGTEPVPLFQIASMAQTRACAKVLRNVLAWVVVLAGYRPTPAEEIDGQVIEPGQERMPGDRLPRRMMMNGETKAKPARKTATVTEGMEYISEPEAGWVPTMVAKKELMAKLKAASIETKREREDGPLLAWLSRDLQSLSGLGYKVELGALNKASWDALTLALDQVLGIASGVDQESDATAAADPKPSSRMKADQAGLSEASAVPNKSVK
jgi:hypothetical protein